MGHLVGLEAWGRTQRVIQAVWGLGLNSAYERHCVNPVCSSGSLALHGRRVWLWCAQCSQQLQWCPTASFPDRGRGRPRSSWSQQHRSLQGKLPCSQLYQMFLFLVAKGSSVCSDPSHGIWDWAVLLGLMAKKRLSFPSSCLASAFWPFMTELQHGQ